MGINFSSDSGTLQFFSGATLSVSCGADLSGLAPQWLLATLSGTSIAGSDRPVWRTIPVSLQSRSNSTLGWV